MSGLLMNHVTTMAQQLVDSDIETTRTFWRRLVSLPEAVVNDPRRLAHIGVGGVGDGEFHPPAASEKLRLIGGPSNGRPTYYQGELVNVAARMPFKRRPVDGAIKPEPLRYDVYRIVTRWWGDKGYRAYVHSSMSDDEARARIDHMVGDAPW